MNQDATNKTLKYYLKLIIRRGYPVGLKEKIIALFNRRAIERGNEYRQIYRHCS